MHLVRHHERRIKAQTKVTDDLILVGLVLIFGYKIRCSGKGDLVNVLLHLIRRHTHTVINKLKGLLLRVYQYLDFSLKVCR